MTKTVEAARKRDLGHGSRGSGVRKHGPRALQPNSLQVGMWRFAVDVLKISENGTNAGSGRLGYGDHVDGRVEVLGDEFLGARKL